MSVTLKADSQKYSPLTALEEYLGYIFPAMTFIVCSGALTRFGLDLFGWLAVYAVTGYLVVSNFRRFTESAIRAWVILAVPLLTLLSTFWSAAPGHTFSASMQFIYTTVIAIWLGTAYSPGKIFLALGIAAGIGVAASVVNGYIQFISAFSEYDGFFIGIFAHKNVLARIVVYFCVSVLVLGVVFKRPVLALGVGALLLPVMLAAESATSLLMYLMVFSMPVVWLVSNSVDSVRKIVVLGIAGLSLVLVAALAVTDIDLVDSVFDKLGKDSTLTGRTFVWSVGWQMFEWKPILGLGFDAFWHAGIFDDVRRVYSALGETINGFHNTFIEVLVSLGIVGEAVFVITMLVVIYKISAWFYFSRSMESLGALYIVIIITIMSFVEIVGFRNHDMNHILLVTMFVLSLGYHKQRSGR